MALAPRRSAAIARRVTTYSLAADVAVALVVGLILGSVVGWIVFAIGLLVTGVLYYNFSQVRKVKGLR